MSERALIIVDVQNDFCEGGSLAVTGGATVAAGITEWVKTHGDRYAAIVATADWHEDPGAHWATAPDSADYRTTWPVHCRAGSPGAAFHPEITPILGTIDAIFRKGRRHAAYSGFEGISDSGDTLASWLRERNVAAVDVVGIATDHCVRATAIDAVEAGFDTTVRLGLTAGVAAETTEAALEQLRGLGVRLLGQVGDVDQADGGVHDL